ncbi:MAG TPA: hypothetical protein ENN29_02700, partial [Candidatus Hydrogenedentes bacterium]|nr:hypothetical protein [Candidatus Hydrogenedentota bacterium]
MPRLSINGQNIEVAENATVLEAARAAGVEIPTLCHCAGVEPQTSCMVCVVKDAATGATLLSCATKAAAGMNIITDDEEIHALRRDTLALLLAEHAGDCEGPCERACPAGLRTPQMLRCLHQGDMGGALAIAREDLLFPALLGRICAAPCERVCRRGQYDKAIAIRSVHGSLAEAFIEEPLPSPQAATGRTVAVIGAGFAGLAATRALAHLGYGCRLYEKEGCLCPRLRGKVSDALVDAEFAFLQAWDVEVCLSTKVALNPDDSFFGVLPLTTCLEENDMVILACEGAAAPDAAKIMTAREEKMPVRAVASGKRAAHQAHALLTNTPFCSKRPFNSHLGRLADDELEAYRKNRDSPGSLRAQIRKNRDSPGSLRAQIRKNRDSPGSLRAQIRKNRDSPGSLRSLGTVPV